MSQPYHPELFLLHELTEAQQRLHRQLLELGRLSEQQCDIPADRADALEALLDRKQRVLREICEINAPAVFCDCARLVSDDSGDDPRLKQAKARLHAEATANLKLWEEIAGSEERSRNQWAARAKRLGAELSAGLRKDALQRAYCPPGAPGPAIPRFVNHLR